MIDVLEVLLDELGIDLRGRNIAVTEHLLNGAEVCAVFKQVRREAVAQGVRRDILIDLRFFLIELDDLPEALAGHAVAVEVDKERRLCDI